MNKLYKYLIFLLAFFVLIGCNKKEVTITSINIDQTTLKESYLLTEFDISSIILIVNKSDNSKQRVALNLNMVDSEYRPHLSEVGTHQIHLSYKGIETSFNITLQLYEEDQQMLEIYNLSVKKGLFEGTLHDWFIHVGENSQPVINSIEVDEQSNLIILFSNDKIVNLGMVHGSNKSIITQIELNNNGDYFVYFSNGQIQNVGKIIKFVNVSFLDINQMVIDNQFLMYDQSALAPLIENVEENTFVGWDKTFTNVTEDIVVKSLYLKSTYIINFDMNEKGNQIAPFTVYKNVDEFRLASHIHKPSNQGSIFYGWFKDKECSDPISIKQMLSLNNDLVVYAKWIEDYNLSFDYVGINSLTINQELSFNSLPIPSKDDCVFLGWYEDNYLTNKIDMNNLYSLQKDTLLYPKWLDDVESLSLEDAIIGKWFSDGFYFIIEDTNEVILYESNNLSHYKIQYYKVYKKADTYYFISNNEIIESISLEENFNFINKIFIKEDSLIVSFKAKVDNGDLFIGLYKENDLVKKPQSIIDNRLMAIKYWYLSDGTLYDFDNSELTSSLTLYGLPYLNKQIELTLDDQIIIIDTWSFENFPVPTKEGFTFVHWTYQGEPLYDVYRFLSLLDESTTQIQLDSVFITDVNYQGVDIIGDYYFEFENMKIVVSFFENGLMATNLYYNGVMLEKMISVWSCVDESIYYMELEDENIQIFLSVDHNYILLEGLSLYRVL